MSSAPSGALSDLMARAEQEWDNDAIHRALLELCESPADLARIAAWYRVRRAEPQRALVADAQLKRVMDRALVHIDVQRSNRRPAPGGNRGKVVLVVLLLLGSAILAASL